MPLVPFDTPWKQQKPSGYFITELVILIDNFQFLLIDFQKDFSGIKKFINYRELPNL